MIWVRIQGGLGNQLFQYALARSLSLKRKIETGLDISFYYEDFRQGNTSYRKFLLSEFMIGEIKIVDKTDYIIKTDLSHKFKRMSERIFLPYYLHSYVREKMPGYDKNILKVKPNAYIDGYWQSYLYFEDTFSLFRDCFKLKSPLSLEALKISDQIKSSVYTVGIHVRRTDYIQKYGSLYVTLGMDYYEAAMKIFLNKNPSVRFFVFSDDIEWCMQNFKNSSNIFFVSNGKLREEEELILMSQCQNNIIANSTFSWWAAWLNSHSAKIVIAPAKWFLKNSDNFIKSLYPSSWILL
jgi:hypothetical protein